MKIPDKAKDIISRIEYATLATVNDNNEPWNSPVFTVLDKNGNVYWGSHENSQHSKNIKANGKVFIVIYDSTTPVGTGLGVYMRAKAELLTDNNDIVFAHKLLQDRRIIPYWKLDLFLKDTPVKLFRATPIEMWINGEGESKGYYVDVRKTVEW